MLLGFLSKAPFWQYSLRTCGQTDSKKASITRENPDSIACMIRQQRVFSHVDRHNQPPCGTEFSVDAQPIGGADFGVQYPACCSQPLCLLCTVELLRSRKAITCSSRCLCSNCISCIFTYVFYGSKLPKTCLNTIHPVQI